MYVERIHYSNDASCIDGLFILNVTLPAGGLVESDTGVTD